jgi:hypothetical protein
MHNWMDNANFIFYFNIMHNFKEHFKDIKVDMENQQGKLVITLSGDPEKLQKLEKKLKALYELCGDEDCCCSSC